MLLTLLAEYQTLGGIQKYTTDGPTDCPNYW